MVLIAATVCTKSGKALVSRQFVEMTKARIEGLLAAFPKLMTAGRQHTFVETESVRYVYQPLDKLYMLLITTKASNILEDLETLRLFSRVVPEYCQHLTETEVLNQAFNLLFAFDEIVALGYRESVNLAQVRSFVEMDSHEEKIYQAVRQTQEREAANRMRERAKELQREKLEAAKRGGPRSNMSYGSSGGFGSSSMSSASSAEPYVEKVNTTPAREQQRPSGRSAMKLGSKSTDADSFVSRLRSEGDTVPTAAAPGKEKEVVHKDHNDVHLRFEERLNLTAGRDGDVQHYELSGLLTLRISNEQFGRIRVHLDNKDTRALQLQTHPNVDKEAFRAGGLIALKQSQRPFPLHSDVGVLKWRLQGGDKTPLSINCWPSEAAGGGCDVNIEFELEQTHLVLTDVVLNIPLPSGNSSVVVHQWEGSYSQKGRSLVWSIPVIDEEHKTGTLEFTVNPAVPNDFFPINVSWTSETSNAMIKAMKVTQADDGTPVDFSQEISFHPDSYEVV
ncbi:unnamed protein product [Plutella xylostella]|uniref:Coatomer subunit delta n=1 Tax=Plutella xylostella TaxID=51655 RepID=A0A8S4EL28_PLUXY|nr:unnamed protein product [Plutella xylostella]